MNIAPLGMLKAHDDIPEWLISEPVAIPYFDGKLLSFTVDGLGQSDKRDIERAIQSFLALTTSDRLAATKYVYRNYQQIADVADDDDLNCNITSEAEVWDHVRAEELFVSRRPRLDRLIYIQIGCNCDWEPEHGLQIVYRQGALLSRVSAQDGHLTYSDAYDVPEDQDTIA